MPAVSFARLTDEVLASYGPSQRAPATRRMMAQALAELAQVPIKPGSRARAFRRSSDLTVGNISRWIEHYAAEKPKRSRERTLALLRCIRVACNTAVAAGWLAGSPFTVRKISGWLRADARPAKVTPPRAKTADEIRRLLAVLDADAGGGSWAAGRLQALVYVYVFTAFRRDEALHILVRNVDLVKRTLTIEPVGTWRPKTVKSARTIPLADPLHAVLSLWLPRCGSEWLFPGRRLKSPWIGSGEYRPIDRIRDAAKRAEIGDITIIGLRKTFGTLAKAMGLGPLEVQAILGHTNTETQAHYDEEDTESLRPAMEKMTVFFAHRRAQ